MKPEQFVNPMRTRPGCKPSSSSVPLIMIIQARVRAPWRCHSGWQCGRGQLDDWAWDSAWAWAWDHA